MDEMKHVEMQGGFYGGSLGLFKTDKYEHFGTE